MSNGSKMTGTSVLVSINSLFGVFLLILGSVDADIGVITPYHAQCLKLKTALRSMAEGVKVGSVEEFQGQVCLRIS
jgi:hypothetical protein